MITHNDLPSSIKQHRVAIAVLESGRVYTRTAPYGGYGDLDGAHGAAYILRNGKIETICHNTPVYRMHVMIDAYQDYVDGVIDATVWNNYATGGYSTRRGLYKTKKTQKMIDIAMSHMLITTTGKSGHDARVSIR
jgi:hypothetical protein